MSGYPDFTSDPSFSRPGPISAQEPSPVSAKENIETEISVRFHPFTIGKHYKITLLPM
jgi:hypothetical protein